MDIAAPPPGGNFTAGISMIAPLFRNAGFVAVALVATAGAASPASHLRSYPYGPHANAQAGLGKVLTTKDGGQIFGFDIDQNGDDGVLASAVVGGTAVSVETFDQDTGKIT